MINVSSSYVWSQQQGRAPSNVHADSAVVAEHCEHLQTDLRANGTLGTRAPSWLLLHRMMVSIPSGAVCLSSRMTLLTAIES